MLNRIKNFEETLTRIRSNLPIQNPLHSFVHNNVLMMFEDREFHTALKDAGRLYRANSYWPLYRYQELFEKKKITEEDIRKGIEYYLTCYHQIPLAEKLGMSGDEFYFNLALSNLAFNDDDIQPEINNSELWQKCYQKMQGQSLNIGLGKNWRARSYWEKYYNESYSSNIHPFIIRLISSYLDQGQGVWPNPYLEISFWEFFIENVRTVSHLGSAWQLILLKKLEQYLNCSTTEVIIKELDQAQIPEEDRELYLLDLLFDLKGWAGMVNKLEMEPWQATVKAPKIKLVDYMAAVLLVELSLDEFHAKEHSTDLSMIYGREDFTELKTFQLSLALYQLTLDFNLDTSWMDTISIHDLLEIISELDQAEKSHKIRIWHEAYEQHYYREALAALAAHRRHTDKCEAKSQVLFCIDDREESLRRHLEEIDPSMKTYGVVGFFGIDMKFRSLSHERLINQCPPVVNPSRVVNEIPDNQEEAKPFVKFLKLRGESDLKLYYQSRTLFRGFFSTLVFGVMSVVPMFFQVFFPNESRKMKEGLFGRFTPKPKTHIHLDRDGVETGYTKKEMAQIVSTILKMCGITKNFKDLIIILGHGSTSNNNPFRQAYGCGACGGNAGIPNSRAFAQMANDPGVREELSFLGIHVPQTSYFISAFHDTCTDDVIYYDFENLPKNLSGLFKQCQTSLREACKRNSFERCQRFSSTAAQNSMEEAVAHVHERSQDLAQPRPEYGHSSNALAIVGKRDLTKGLFLNRRSFLLTYDWSVDPDGSILQQIILGGIPVAVNINMDYYFSSVDNDNYGCGSKLPLNLTGLLGVMTGSQSDLRIGLARQMIEIHEPIRNLTIVEAPLETVQKIFQGHSRLKRMLYNHWMRLAVYDPKVSKWYLFINDHFEEYTPAAPIIKHYASSLDLVKKHDWDEDFAEIDS